jgi:molybdenum cofactor biosynthesis enzyme MoaA
MSPALIFLIEVDILTHRENIFSMISFQKDCTAILETMKPVEPQLCPLRSLHGTGALKITSDGKLRSCLFALEETDLKSLLRNGASDEAIARAIRECVRSKQEGHLINQSGFVRPARTMSQIGG